MNSTESQDDFKRALNVIKKKFLAGEEHGESDANLAEAFLELILKQERARRGVDCKSESWESVDADTMKNLQTWNTRDPDLVLSEKAFRELATNRGTAAINLITKAVEVKANALSTEQSRIAKKPRPKNPITIYTEGLVAKNPSLTEQDLIKALMNILNGPIIERYSNEEFVPTDEASLPVKKSALRSTLSRAKTRAKNQPN